MAILAPDIYLNAIARARGSSVEINDAATLGQSDADCKRIVKKTGVRSRPIAAPDEYTSDLAFTATRALLDQTGVLGDDVGTLVVCTQTPDHLIPGVSSRLHGRLNFPRDCFVIDINQGCSGFVLGTQMMAAMPCAPGKSAILVNADTYSRLIRQDDLTTRVLFGDAAAATLYSTRPQGLRVAYCKSFADGSGYDSFVARGSATRPDETGPQGICMDGPGILNFALRVVPDAIGLALSENHLRIEQIRMVLFHQANSFVTHQLARKLKLSDEQAPENCAELGNTVSASIPLLLHEQMPKLRAGDRVLAVGFGVGFSWGCTLFEYVSPP